MSANEAEPFVHPSHQGNTFQSLFIGKTVLKEKKIIETGAMYSYMEKKQAWKAACLCSFDGKRLILFDMKQLGIFLSPILLQKNPGLLGQVNWVPGKSNFEIHLLEHMINPVIWGTHGLICFILDFWVAGV